MKQSLRPSVLGRLLIAAAATLLVLIVGLPLGAIIVGAFGGDVAQTFAALRSRDTLHAAILTAEVAAATLLVNGALGVVIAWTLTKYRFVGKALLSAIVDVPLSVSPVVAGLALLLALGPHSPIGAWLTGHGAKLLFAFPGIAIATIFVTFPFVARETAAALEEQGRELEEAALTTGASLWNVVWHVTLPGARVGLLNGVVLCAARAFGEFGAVSVVSGNIRGQTETMSLHIEALYNDYNVHGAFALSLVLVLASLCTVVVRRLWIERA